MAICAMLEEFFEDSLDGEVLTATTASEALMLLKKEQPEGMLLDIHLGSRLDGFDILSHAGAQSVHQSHYDDGGE